MEKVSFLTQLIISFPEATLVGLVGLSILGLKPTPKQVLSIGFVQAVFGDFTSLLPLPFGIHTVLQLFFFPSVVYLIMDIPYKFSFLVSLLGASIYILVEAISFPLLLTLTGFSLPEIVNNIWIKTAFFLPQAIILIWIIYLIRRFNINFARYYNLIIDLDRVRASKDSFQLSKSFPLMCLFLAQNLLISLNYLAKLLGPNESTIFQTLNSIPFSIIILVLMVASIFMIKRVVNLIEDEIATKTQLDSLQHVKELLNTIRSQRHDFSHDLQVIYGLLEVEAFQEAKSYIRNSMSEIAATSELVKTDNLGITALLQTKTGLAEAKKIKLEIIVKSSLKNLPIESRDVNIILGNLIDNALEVVAGLVPEQRQVKVVLSQDLTGYVFEVINSGPGIEPELIGQIFNPGFSTKKEGRGMGLYSVTKLVQKYCGKVQVASEHGYTCFTIFLPQ